METLKSETMKKRVLPSWMTTPVDEREVVPVKIRKRRRMVAVPMGAATRAPSTKTVYCMNEAEMVDVALGILIESRKQEKLWEQPFLADADKLQLSPSSSESPHTNSPRSGSEEEDSRENSPVLGLSPSQGPGTSKSTCSPSPEEDKDEEEDVLKYVREIFFS
ncbi:cell cycle regulator of non-homologous end joining [Nannospalax galili]|uniref:cell cycle regulator of non-homologous end joining n=1 Tax=Nannospalax galili TaxID=1026970 RepID=UPI0004ED44F8|nr:cell cycle regulator of non-homologous end joining [Nannospalax galili]